MKTTDEQRVKDLMRQAVEAHELRKAAELVLRELHKDRFGTKTYEEVVIEGFLWACANEMDLADIFWSEALKMGRSFPRRPG